MEKIKLTVCGRDYFLKVDENPERIYKLAADLEKNINDMKGVMKSRTETEVVTLIALDAMDEAYKAKLLAPSEADETAKLKLIEAEAEIEKLKTELNGLKENAVSLNEQVYSAQSEMLQLGDVKDTENKQLREKLLSYEKTFDGYVKERDDEVTLLKQQHSEEIRKLKELNEEVVSAESEMLQLSNVKDDEKQELREKIQAYEKTFELFSKKRDNEVKELEEKLKKALNNKSVGDTKEAEKLKEENASLRKALKNYEKTFDEYVKEKALELQIMQEDIQNLSKKHSELKAQTAKQNKGN